jgi:hypothetical protein
MNENVFLFNPENQKFLSGESRRIEQGYSRKIPVFQAALFTLLLVTNVVLIALNISDLSAIESPFSFAVETQGTVQACSRGASIFGTMRVNYTYSANNADGSTNTFSGNDVVYGTCTSETVTTPIQIRYLPSDPSRSIAVNGDADTRVQIITALVFVVVYIVGALASWIGWRRLKRLEKEGRVMRGSIVSYDKRLPGNRNVMARYQFTNDVGIVLKGRFPILLKRLEGKPLPPVGTPMAVVYADDRTYQAL